MPSNPRTDTTQAAEQVAAAAHAHETQEAAQEGQEGREDPTHAGTTDAGESPSARASEDGHDDRGQTTSGLRREAANYRRQLRETQAERDTLRARVDQIDRAGVEATLAQRMTNPSDLWLVADLAGLRSEDGQVDAGKVEAAVDAAVKDRPHWKLATTSFDQGARAPHAEGLSIGAALKRVVGQQ